MHSQHQQEQLPPNVQEDLYLLDVIGGASQTALHPTRPTVAYSSGCMVIVYDLMTDQKVNLVHHQHEIMALAFTPPGAGASQQGGEFLISIDFDRNDVGDPYSASSSTMCLWSWQKGQCLQEIQIPNSQNNESFVGQSSPYTQGHMSKHFQIAFEKVGGLFLVLESGIHCDSGYRVTLWNLSRRQRVEMLSQMDLELQNSCLGLMILPKQSHHSSLTTLQRQSLGGAASHYSSQQQLSLQQRLRFLTLERQTVKIWEYNQGHADLQKRIQIKQSMKQCVCAELTGYLIILGANGKVLILDQEGDFVSTIKRDMTFFTVIGTAHDKLLLGTDRGTVCVFHMASLQFISEIPYQLSLLQHFQLNDTQFIGVQNAYSKQEPSLYALGPPVMSVCTTQNMRFLFIKYADQSFAVLDRTVAQPQQAIMGYQCGHFQKVTGINWLDQSSSKRKPAVTKDGLIQSQSNGGTFITCSQDMSIYVWKHFGDRWSFSYIDVVKACFDQSLSYQRKLSDKSTQNLELTAIQVYPRSPLVVVGDNQGVVRVFQVTQEQAVFVSSHQLMKGMEAQKSQSEDPIKEIHVTQDEQYAIVTFQSGLISCYDVKNSFNFMGVIERDAQRFCYSNQLEVRMKVLEEQLLTSKIQDEKPLFLNSPLDQNQSLNQSSIYQTSFRILSTTSPNTVSLQQVQIKGYKLSKTSQQQFIIDEGKVSGFDVHPSGDYVLITSNKGRIFLYRIDTGELRGTIKIPLHARECLIDPSGLYVLIQVPPFSPKHTANLTTPQFAQQEALSNLQTHEKDLERTTVLMFEIGTGKACAELKSLFEVSVFKFSPEGQYLALGSRTGSVCVWALGDHLYQNVKQVLDSLKLQPDFWSNYPIFLEDYGTYGIAQNQLEPGMIPHDYMNQQDEVPYDYKMNSPQQIIGSASDRIQSSNTKNPYTGQKPGLQNEPHQMISNVQTFLQQPKSQIRPPMNNLMVDRSIQNNSQSILQIPVDRSFQNDQLLRQQREEQLKQQQQNKFLRKTFVEDQQTQITPQISGYMDQQPHAQPRNIRDTHPQQSQRSAQIQTSTQVPQIPSYNQRNQQNLPQGQSLLKQYNSQSSLLSSPNKAELLYTDEYQKVLQGQHVRPIGTHPPQTQIYNDQPRQQFQSQGRSFDYQPGNMPQHIPQHFQNSRQGSNQKPLQAQQKSVQEYVQTQNNPYLAPVNRDHRQVFQEEPVVSEPFKYVEHVNPIQPYNPFQQNNLQQPQTKAYGTVSSLPYSSIQQDSPQRNASMPYQNSLPQNDRIRFQSGNNRQQQQDPIDIDDDVSDHGPESLDYQLKELDGMNKYMQNVKAPTRFIQDQFFEDNGRDGSRAYTLEKMRQEEQRMSLGGSHENNGETSSQGGSNYELVEEMYENLNSFDERLKRQNQQTPIF